MNRSSEYFTSFDGTRLLYRSRLRKDSDCVLLMVHGFGEHSGRYEELFQELGGLNASIFIHDLRGHGHSDGRRVYVNRFDEFVNDLLCFRALIKEQVPRARNYVLMGQSMGGLIAVHTALRNQADWNAVVLLSPYFGLTQWEGPLTHLTSAVDCLAPRMMWDNPFPVAHLSHDPEAVRQYKADEWIQRRITIRLAKEMFRAAQLGVERAREWMLPLFIFAGGQDKIVSLAKTKRFFEQARSGEKSLRVFDGFYHELIHELGREKPISEIRNCLTRLVG